ncbi:hypothetical protein GYMLUDRAFT_57208 [Collybiopsis luxurians FD-317 M1]|uniref:Uncharacterized protein n=1 Tax=Collybiopsis luxurians FD-317 M1 TaxID=944289 RepID=A0A0D0D4E8_9AGAR|nr:hypothetical protein GYMLUDRAFT_57208 [Collybiopsis luxurians FD-317 M1]
MLSQADAGSVSSGNMEVDITKDKAPSPTQEFQLGTSVMHGMLTGSSGIQDLRAIPMSQQNHLIFPRQSKNLIHISANHSRLQQFLHNINANALPEEDITDSMKPRNLNSTLPTAPSSLRTFGLPLLPPSSPTSFQHLNSQDNEKFRSSCADAAYPLNVDKVEDSERWEVGLENPSRNPYFGLDAMRGITNDSSSALLAEVSPWELLNRELQAIPMSEQSHTSYCRSKSRYYSAARLQQFFLKISTYLEITTNL